MMQLALDQAIGMAMEHLQGGRPGEAASLCRQILQTYPDHKLAIVHLGIALHSMGQMEDARAAFEQGIVRHPDWPEGWNNLGVTLRQMGRMSDAIAAFRKSIQLRPEFPDALSNLGNALHDAGDPEQGIPLHQKSIALRPDFVAARCNLANAFKFCGRIEEAIATYRRALMLSPNDPAIHHFLGMTLLLSGDYPQGLREHEWRIGIKEPRPVCWDFPKPRWDGSPLRNRCILLHAEQGLGDTIQFARYAPLVAGMGGKVVLQCQAELARLLNGLAGVEQVVPQAEPLPDYDIHCQLMSLPYLFGTTPPTIPAPMRYLRADANKVAQWNLQVSSERTKLKVGIVWAGQKQYTDDRNRSLELSMFAPLAGVSGVSFFSLQKGPASIETRQSPGIHVVDWSNDLHDFVETAALIENMDLVISVDTAVAHLAGAMGKPVWVLLPFVPDWRWGMHGVGSPWYPSARLFRQKRMGQWGDVMDELVKSVRDLV